MSPKANTTLPPISDELPFSEAMTELETVAERLKHDGTSLEEAMALFERGVGLIKHCQKRLDKAQGTVEELINDLSANGDGD